MTNNETLDTLVWFDIDDLKITPNILSFLTSIDKMPVPRIQKCMSLDYLTQFVKNGSVVELGAYLGIGCITLAMSLRNRGKSNGVYTVDDFSNRVGWAGEKYVPSYENRFWRNVHRSGITIPLIKKDIISAAQEYKETNNTPVDLLFWDLGTDSVLEDTIKPWLEFVPVGGIVAIHDTFDRRFKGQRFIRSHPDYVFAQTFKGGVEVGVRVE